MANGLHYLHSCNIIHGDLKAVSCVFPFSESVLIPTNSKSNVLVDGDGRARLTDFGLSSIVRVDGSLASPQDYTGMHATAWAAPEILHGNLPSKEGDIFTFAMVVVEVCIRGVPSRSSRFLTSPALGQTFTGESPFSTDIHTATLDILNGKRPERPTTLDNEELWKIMKRCWSEGPGERPTAFQLLEFFRVS